MGFWGKSHGWQQIQTPPLYWVRADKVWAEVPKEAWSGTESYLRDEGYQFETVTWGSSRYGFILITKKDETKR